MISKKTENKDVYWRKRWANWLVQLQLMDQKRNQFEIDCPTFVKMAWNALKKPSTGNENSAVWVMKESQFRGVFRVLELMQSTVTVEVMCKNCDSV